MPYSLIKKSEAEKEISSIQKFFMNLFSNFIRSIPASYRVTKSNIMISVIKQNKKNQPNKKQQKNYFGICDM